MKVSLFFNTIEGNKALHIAVKAMEIKTDIQCYKLIHLENTMVMYGVYNAETFENL